MGQQYAPLERSAVTLAVQLRPEEATLLPTCTRRAQERECALGERDWPQKPPSTAM